MQENQPRDQDAFAADDADTATIRKARGAFFTPPAIARFMTDWALRDARDTVLEPSCGDAEFLVHAVRRLTALGARRPAVAGVEIHAHSADAARARVAHAGGRPDIQTSDFFAVAAGDERGYDAVVGNPPYVRSQNWSGEPRDRSRSAARAAGVELSASASSWAAFTAHATSFLAPGGRLAFVLPAELLSVNYAAAVRRFLYEKFSSVDLVAFDDRVFAEAEVDVVLLLVDGYGQGPAEHITVHRARNAVALDRELPAQKWTPSDPSAKWTPALLPSEGLAAYAAAAGFTRLEEWGDTTLGTVTGNNNFFALSPARAAELGLDSADLLPLSPPGSGHLRGLDLAVDALAALGRSGARTLLFRPAAEPSGAARAYIAEGQDTGVSRAYKCRVRATWWRVPLLAPADLLITAMNADTARITSNEAGAHHLNSVYGIYLNEDHRDLGRELLALASLNSVTLLGAEVVGRAYGGGILKLEPREADALPVPGPALVAAVARELSAARAEVALLLDARRLLDAVAVIDRILLVDGLGMSDSDVRVLRAAHAVMSRRRRGRGKGAETS
ncbi:class I SAM-dependent DNA methyltransferase [Conyzicola sp.]|uniref:HsdM family class I SAM-dependent methyltransferase n=1 Tax=Conyzicola sp. TaxID=1969404 RepID=UPI0039891285